MLFFVKISCYITFLLRFYLSFSSCTPYFCDHTRFMFLRKYRILIVITFMGIFAAKMVISGAPVFFPQLDKVLMNAVIMQLEVENHGDDTGKSSIKYVDHKLMLHRYDLVDVPLATSKCVTNRLVDHFRRYLDPFHPLVPTPPPNFS